MTLGELREQLKDMPDDTELVWFDEYGWVHYEAQILRVIPKAAGYPAVVLIEGGQGVDIQLDLIKRHDEVIGLT